MNADMSFPTNTEGDRKKLNNVLVIEASDHSKIMEQVFILLRTHCNLTFCFIPCEKRYDWREHFINHKHVKVSWWFLAEPWKPKPSRSSVDCGGT